MWSVIIYLSLDNDGGTRVTMIICYITHPKNSTHIAFISGYKIANTQLIHRHFHSSLSFLYTHTLNNIHTRIEMAVAIATKEQLTSMSSLKCRLRIWWLVIPKLGDMGATWGGRMIELEIRP